ncbi:MAG: hypothetical protein GY756_17880 [bacterium]|nr:hypothetical protein [bacterium]
MSGAGTNLGIEYQQRVSAWFLVQLYLETSLNLFFRNFNKDFIPLELHYESDNAIDDLNVIGSNYTLFAQIKRNLAMSSDEKSDFYSVLNQFIENYKDSVYDDKYLLITSSKSSKKIRIELGKITDSIRLNKNNFKKNPLNKSEEKTLKTVEECFNKIITKFDYSLDLNDLYKILARTYILTFDIESTESLEISTLIQLKTITDIDPRKIWDILQTKSLELAGKRLSISRDGINDILTPYLISNEINISESAKIFKTIFPSEQNFASGMEYFLGIMDEDNKKIYVILEFYRFDEHGSNRIKIQNNHVSFNNGFNFEIIFRCSTQSRLMEMIESSKYNDEKYSLRYIQTKIDSEEENNSPFALAWSEKLNKSLTNSKLLYCVHCSKFVSQHKSFTVEYILNDVPKVGLVHEECLKSTDRIIGIVEFPVFEDRGWLKFFDLSKWIYAYRRSINISERTMKMNNKSVHLLWDDNYIYKEGEYCIGFNLSDGSVEYCNKRSKIISFSYSEIDKQLAFMNDMLNKAESENDPWCYLSESRQFGKYSYLLTQKDSNENILEIKDCFIDEYSIIVKNNYENADYYYAPLLYIINKENGDEFKLGQYTVLLSNPFEINNYIDNWKKANEILPNYRIELLETDEHVDNFFRNEIGKGHEILINPLIDRNHNIVSAIPLQIMPKVKGI